MPSSSCGEKVMSKRKNKGLIGCRSGGWSAMYHDVTRSETFANLKPVSKCLFVLMQDKFIPISREKISVSVVNAAKWIGCNKDTAGKAFRELETAGFIELVEHHLWQQRKARVFRLTWRQFDGKEPTDEWKDV